MLRYRKDRHLDLLRERLATVSTAVPDGAPGRAAATEVASEEREELMRRLMVVHLGRRWRGETTEPREFAQTIDRYWTCCDPTDLRQVDVLHNLFENVAETRPSDGSCALLSRPYAQLLRLHIERLEAGEIRGGHGVGAGEPTPIAPNGTLRVLLLADNFVSGSRSWRPLAGRAIVQPRVLFCNNSGHHPSAYLSRLTASLGRLVASGGLRPAVSMLRSRPRVSTQPLGHASNTVWLRLSRFDVGLHSMAIIYRQATIASFRLGILNAHIGFLPGMRGRSVLEWSLVLGVDPCVSTFFIDEGIDTGALIVDRYQTPPDTVRSAPSVEAAKQRLFELDGYCYERALATLVSGGDGFRNAPPGPRFYVMSRLLARSITAD